MKLVHTDVAVIGAGTAGLAAYRAAKSAGATALLIEGDAHGTTCARVGCMPSKLLVAAAEAAHAVKAAAAFGVHVDGAIQIDGRAVMARVRQERDRFVGFVLRDIGRMPEDDRLSGHVEFIDDHSLDVGRHTRVAAGAVVIATGSRPTIADAYANMSDRVVVSDDVFEWEDLPQSVAVIGAGIVGLELGQALHRLGVRVAIFGRGGGVGPIGDPEILAYAIAKFKQEFTLEPDALIADICPDGNRVTIHRTGADRARQTDTFDCVLIATGRMPNVQGLGLENTSVRLDLKGVPRYDPSTTQTERANRNSGATHSIFIAGDAGDFIPLLHEAADERRGRDNASRRFPEW